ncbi:MAG: hypothetical protein N2204_01495 [Anaerolineae bacterium]|nr:hypothetical protein [Anaerolineae bacterium]
MSENRSHRHHHHHRQPGPVRTFLRKYRFEIIWVAVVALGIFLLFERFNIRASVMRWLRTAATIVLQGAGRLDDAVMRFLARTTLSDAVAYVLILGAVVALLLRVRWRLQNTPRYTELKCPRCGGDLHRVHRTTADHLISVVVPVRRYRCGNRDCRWHGRRVVASESLAPSKAR